MYFKNNQMFKTKFKHKMLISFFWNSILITVFSLFYFSNFKIIYKPDPYKQGCSSCLTSTDRKE